MPQFPEIPEPLSIIILSAVAKHEKQIGIGTLALILKGSKDKQIWNRKLYESPFFGGLLYYQINVLKNFIRQLKENGYLKIVMVTGNPFPAPMLMLTEKGTSALKSKTKIKLEIKKEMKPVIFNDAVKTTLETFIRTKSIAETAKEKNIVESTVWKHLIDAIKLGKLSAYELVSEEKIKLILEAKEKLNPKKLKDLKSNLPENISYEEIKCVLVEKSNNF